MRYYEFYHAKNDEINEEWLSDKSRFACDGLKRQRLIAPMLKKPDGEFEAVEWESALIATAQALKAAKGKIAVVAGGLADVEAMVAYKDLVNRLGSEVVCTEQAFPTEGAVNDLRSNYLLNNGIQACEHADLVLLVGTNPRYEAPLLNTRLRKAYVHNEANIALIGPNVNLSYKHEDLGTDLQVLSDIASGRHQFFDRLKNAQNPLIIVGAEALARKDGAQILAAAKAIAAKLKPADPEWRVFNVLQTTAGQTGALDVGYTPGVEAAISSQPKVLILFGADAGKIKREDLPKDCFVIYQGHHGDNGATIADAILPGAAYTEKQATYVNTEGRAQQTLVAVTPPGLAREDWKIVRALSEVVGTPLPYDTLDELRDRLEQISPHLVAYGKRDPGSVDAAAAQATNFSGGRFDGSIDVKQKTLRDFFMTDPISRASPTMAKCVVAAAQANQ